MDGADLVRVRSGGAFADGPNWFVGDDNTATIWDWHQAQSCPSLANHVVERQRRAAWLELSHAHDRCHIVAKDLTHLERHDLIGLSVVTPALPMSYLDERALEVGEHRGRNVARMRARVLRMDILRAP